MTDYRKSVREHLASNKKLLAKGDLTDTEATALSKKIDGLSALLSDRRKNPRT